MESFLDHRSFDVVIVGAGPVGLALAVELQRNGFATLVVDRRPPLGDDPRIRPQLLVAREGDLANLARLGVDVFDESLVAMLTARCDGDACVAVSPPDDFALPRDVAELSAQPPLALVPIGRLQAALLALARAEGVEVAYDCDVTSLRRHARTVSLRCANGATAHARMAVVATGAARALVTAQARGEPASKLVGGLFAPSATCGRWARFEMEVPGLHKPARCTMLESPTGGTALIVDARIGVQGKHEQLLAAFASVARRHALDGAPLLAPPVPFTTAATALPCRFIAGDGRAPVVFAGDAAQTGHVFTGQTCFVNVALAGELARALVRARAPIVDGTPNAPALLHALARYNHTSAAGAALLARASRRHAPTPAGVSFESLREAGRHAAPGAARRRRNAAFAAEEARGRSAGEETFHDEGASAILD